MPAWNPRANDIFLEALERPAAERPAFVQAACGDDAVLHGQVQALLQASEHAGSFLAAAAAAPEQTIGSNPITEAPGTNIGPYKLLQQIGEGGMGVVWMAEQIQPVQRKVALKVIKPGMDSRQVIARFEAERQALAMMDHVNIARVFDGGTTGRSPLAPREVSDENLAVDSGHDPSERSCRPPLAEREGYIGRPYFVMELVHGVPITKYCDDNHLTPRVRLELFVPVCQAIQHAHQKGIIHRDIKPSNVMVTLYDGKPVPKVIDFGVAKATEQKLTERTLFTQYGTMVGTLEYMSPEQAEMSALGVDTRSDIYSLGVLLYELLTGNTPLTHIRMKEGAYAEILRMIKEVEPPKPSTRLSDSGEALASISVNRHMEPAKLTKLMRGELDWIVMKCLEKDRNRRYETANGFAQDVQRYLADEPVLACPPSAGYRLRKFARRNRSGLAVAGLVLFFLVLLGSVAGWALRDRAARAREVELEQMARAAEQANHLERAVERAELVQRKGRRGEALAALERAQLLARETEPLPPLRQRIDSLQRLLDAEGQDLDFVARFEAIRREDQTEVDAEKNIFIGEKGYPKLREALKQYGIEVAVTPPADAVARIQGRPPAVQQFVFAALDECLLYVPNEDATSRKWSLEVLQKADADPWRREVRKAWRNLPELERLVKDESVSRHPANFLVMTIRALPAKSPSRLDLARRVQRAYPDDFWANSRLGTDLNTSGKPLEAIHYHTAALALQPRNPGSYLNRSIAFEGSQNLAQALADINQAIDLAPRYAIAWRIKGRLLQKMKDLDNAEVALRQALVLDPKDTYARSWLIDQLKKAGRLRDVEVELRHAVALDPKSVDGHIGLGHALSMQNKLEEAGDCFRKAIELDEKNAGARQALGLVLRRQKKLEEAVAYYKKAIKLDPKAIWAHHDLALILREQNKLEEASDCFRKVIELDEKNASARQGLGFVLRAQKKLDEAVANYKKAIKVDPKAIWAHHGLAMILREQNKPEEASDCFRKVIELDEKNASAHWGLGSILREQKKLDEAIVVFRQAITLEMKMAAASHLLPRSQGNLANLLNDRAWQLVSSGDPKSRDPRRAIDLAQEAAALVPNNGAFRNTLGVAHYRTGNWKAALVELNQSLKLRKGGSSEDFFFLAMAHWQLDQKDEARMWYDKAVEWMEKNQPKSEELRRFRAEAEELMKVEKKKD